MASRPSCWGTAWALRGEPSMTESYHRRGAEALRAPGQDHYKPLTKAQPGVALPYPGPIAHPRSPGLGPSSLSSARQAQHDSPRSSQIHLDGVLSYWYTGDPQGHVAAPGGAPGHEGKTGSSVRTPSCARFEAIACRRTKGRQGDRLLSAIIATTTPRAAHRCSCTGSSPITTSRSPRPDRGPRALNAGALVCSSDPSSRCVAASRQGATS